MLFVWIVFGDYIVVKGEKFGEVVVRFDFVCLVGYFLL